ncbi:Tyrosine-protein kinase transmembrane receptor Ror [Holothuria leucospilota]|uniref:Tyrosine-protein kinase transmembrane receptor Ror n=1 Tax=Holothuria leucospilota TaxID=206669 RepID=A0A9Q1H6L1_HOLLE|nr:Tyrosine-protein kinase transmembrane receptor Ror [Holothuria leucospilota]
MVYRVEASLILQIPGNLICADVDSIKKATPATSTIGRNFNTFYFHIRSTFRLPACIARTFDLNKGLNSSLCINCQNTIKVTARDMQSFMDLFLAILIIFSSMDIKEEVVAGEKICYTSNITADTVRCEIDLNETVCLVCPIFNTEPCSSWWLEDSRVTRFTNYIEEPQYNKNEINCHPQNYSLRVLSIGVQREFYYTCRDCLPNATFSYGLILITKVTTSLEVTMNNRQDQNLWSLQHGKMETFYCTVLGAISPFNLTLYVNERESSTRVFYEESNQTRKYNSSVSFVIPKRVSTVRCNILGPYIVSNSANLSIRGANTENERNDTVPQNRLIALYICVPCLFLASILTSLILYKKAKGYRQFKSDERRKSDRVVNVDTFNTENYDENLCPYSDITTEEQETTNEKPPFLSTANISLVTLLKTCGSFEYWIATYVTESSTEVKCFAKRLSNDATLEDARTFSKLVLKLKSLEKNNFTVLLLSVSIEELPYTICYEHMECGSLRDFMLKRYQQARKSRMLLSNRDQDILPAEVRTQIQELLTFASMIAEAMKFISSQNFSHPALSLKKVLLSEYCECKLYDIYPSDMAMGKVKELMKKQYPPVAWMAPETIFLQEYLPMSDVWSFAVLLWELFSLGEVPFARSTKDEIEHALRDGFVMAQPLHCPGAIYEIMLSCWNNAAKNRPSYEDLLTKIRSIMETYEQREGELPSTREVFREPYFVLDPDQTNDYI